MRLIPLLLALFLVVPTAHADTLDIGITGDDYLWMERFQSDAEAVASYLITIEPYKSYAEHIRFQIVPTQRDLYCAASSSTTRLFTCNTAIAKDVFAQEGYSPHKILVLWDHQDYGGSGGTDVCVSYNGSQMKAVSAHECLGHTIGKLADEYNLYINHPTNTDQWYRQCWKGAEPPEYGGTWVLNCMYPNFWRQLAVTASGSEVNSIMHSLSNKLFNEKSTEIIVAELNRIIGLPIISLTAVPTEGIAPLEVTFTATATSPNGGGITYAWDF